MTRDAFWFAIYTGCHYIDRRSARALADALERCRHIKHWNNSRINGCGAVWRRGNMRCIARRVRGAACNLACVNSGRASYTRSTLAASLLRPVTSDDAQQRPAALVATRT